MDYKKIEKILKYTESELLIKFESILLDSLPIDEYHRSELLKDEQSIMEQVLKRHHDIYTSSPELDATKLKEEEYHLYTTLKELERQYELYVLTCKQQGLKTYQIARNYHGIPIILFKYINEITYEEYQKYLTLLYFLNYNNEENKFRTFDTLNMCMLIVEIVGELTRRNNKKLEKNKFYGSE